MSYLDELDDLFTIDLILDNENGNRRIDQNYYLHADLNNIEKTLRDDAINNQTLKHFTECKITPHPRATGVIVDVRRRKRGLYSGVAGIYT